MGLRVSTASGIVGGEVWGSPHLSSSPSCGASCAGGLRLLALLYNGLTQSRAWGRQSPSLWGHSRAGHSCGRGYGDPPGPGLSNCITPMLHGKPLQAAGAVDATGFLLTVIKSSANSLGGKNSHDEDLSWAPIPDLSCEGACYRDPQGWINVEPQGSRAGAPGDLRKAGGLREGPGERHGQILSSGHGECQVLREGMLLLLPYPFYRCGN